MGKIGKKNSAGKAAKKKGQGGGRSQPAPAKRKAPQTIHMTCGVEVTELSGSVTSMKFMGGTRMGGARGAAAASPSAAAASPASAASAAEAGVRRQRWPRRAAPPAGLRYTPLVGPPEPAPPGRRSFKNANPTVEKEWGEYEAAFERRRARAAAREERKRKEAKREKRRARKEAHAAAEASARGPEMTVDEFLASDGDSDDS